ncbi:hypothetical protein [Mycolicibacterium gadium]|uniref:hypothetical protein n=1 Tax=Mycolicibacterium gadium TaxID=1794 RepID=UPI0013D2006F|nr:hypothetical protein [Mycolicibacterium gadium]
MWSSALIVGGLCAALIATAPAALAEPTPGYPATDANGVPTNRSGGPAPTMNGITCTGGHYGVCFAMAQSQQPRRTPRVTVGHSPTVRN